MNIPIALSFPKLSRTALLFFFVFASFHTFANENDKVVLKEYKTVYEFRYNKRTKQPEVKETIKMVFEALKSNVKISVPAFYDENSSVSPATILDNKNKKVGAGTICGDYEDGDIFHSDVQLCVYNLAISSKGEKVTFSSTKEYRNMRYFTSVYLPYSYKALQRTVEFHIPEWMELELEEYHLQNFGVLKNETQDKKNNTKVITYTAANLNGYEQGPYMPGRSYTYPHVLPILRAYKQGDQQVDFMRSTQDLYNWYYGLVKEVKNDRAAVTAKVTELIKDKPSKEEQAKAIYYWVQDNIRYIAFEEGIAGFKPETCQQVFKDRYGDCKGMANLTKEMLLQAGIDARLAWIGTNDLNYTYKTNSLAVDNHMICVAYIDGNMLILDATEKFISLKDYAERIQGKELMIENKDNFILHKVPVLKPDRNKVERHYSLKINAGTLAGKGKVLLNGESKTSLLYVCNNVRNEGTENVLRDRLIGASKDITVQSMEYSSLSEREKPFKVDFDVTLTKNLTDYNGEYYFQPDFQPDFEHLKIEEDRVSKIDFKEKMNRFTEVRLQIPAGYKVSHTPAAFNLTTEEFSFSYTYKVEKNEVVFRKQILLPKGEISKTSLAQWNQGIKKMQEQSKEQIILSKK